MPVNWRALVRETIRRRRAEKMTQRQHAALASVSVPTIVAFDRGERTLSLAKAFDILRVVGLVEEPPEEGAQEIFVRDAQTRWRQLTDKLPQDSPARFPNGWYRIDYALEGDIRQVEPNTLLDIVKKAIVRHTGWPMFVSLRRPELAPYEIDGVVECWLRPGASDFERNFEDAAHCDFWRAAPAGRMLLMRGYLEDTQETIPVGTIFDTTLPILRLGEALLHASRLARLLAVDGSEISVRLRALYTGLTGRTLHSWANPLSGHSLGGRAARNDEALLEVTAPAKQIDDQLARFVLPLVTPLYERFGVTGLSIPDVDAELNRMRQKRFGRDELANRG